MEEWNKKKKGTRWDSNPGHGRKKRCAVLGKKKSEDGKTKFKMGRVFEDWKSS
jgi:hypothetical protein